FGTTCPPGQKVPKADEGAPKARVTDTTDRALTPTPSPKRGREQRRSSMDSPSPACGTTCPPGQKGPKADEGAPKARGTDAAVHRHDGPCPHPNPLPQAGEGAKAQQHGCSFSRLRNDVPTGAEGAEGG